MYLFCAISSQHNYFETPSCCSVYVHSSFLFIAEREPFFKTTTVSLPLLKVLLKSSSLSCNPQFLNFPLVAKCAVLVGLFVLGRKSVHTVALYFLSYLHLLRVISSLSLIMTFL